MYHFAIYYKCSYDQLYIRCPPYELMTIKARNERLSKFKTSNLSIVLSITFICLILSKK